MHVSRHIDAVLFLNWIKGQDLPFLSLSRSNGVAVVVQSQSAAQEDLGEI